jgi:hypothetical protein
MQLSFSSKQTEIASIFYHPIYQFNRQHIDYQKAISVQ